MQQKFQLLLARFIAWLTQDKHKEKIQQIKGDVERAFTEHPQETGETYLEHLWFTISMAARFFYTSIVIMVHGLFPFLCTRTASLNMENIYRIMKTRIPKNRRDEMEREEQQYHGA